MIKAETTWAELVQIEPMFSLVLERYDVHGKSTEATLEELLCGNAKELGFVIRLLNLYADPGSFRLADYSDNSLTAILEYLQRTHRLYELRFLPKMDMCIEGIKRNFPHHPVAPVLDAFFRTYRNELLEHIELEEKKLFPYALSLYNRDHDFNFSVKEFKLQHDHHIDDELGETLQMVKTEFPEIANSMSFRSFSSLLEQFEKDLFVHHLIEERVFLSRVYKMEVQALELLYSK